MCGNGDRFSFVLFRIPLLRSQIIVVMCTHTHHHAFFNEMNNHSSTITFSLFISQSIGPIPTRGKLSPAAAVRRVKDVKEEDESTREGGIRGNMKRCIAEEEGEREKGDFHELSPTIKKAKVMSD